VGAEIGSAVGGRVGWGYGQRSPRRTGHVKLKRRTVLRERHYLSDRMKILLGYKIFSSLAYLSWTDLSRSLSCYHLAIN
jgi:hypothetical protein